MAAEYALPVAPDEKAVEQAADELYGLAPGEFTSARDARAKELRSAGDREVANAVKALRKPTVAAWALNQLSRRKGKDLDRLLAAGEKLRGAQEELLAGGDRSAFQDAAARERELVADLTATTVELAGEAGERGPGLEEKVAATLHAAALDNETAAELRAGRLLREREAIGGFGGFGAAAPAPEPAPARKREPAKKAAKARTAKGSDARKDAKAREDAERRKDAEQRKDAGQRKDAERREAAERRQRLAAARTDERHARRELEAAEKALGSAAARAEAAEAHAADANKRAKTAKQRLEEARRAQTAARKAHARAEKALASAESG